MAASLTADLLAHARRTLGFDLAGVAEAVPLTGAQRLMSWLAADRHGEMRYMADTAGVRGDPSCVLPGARSVICVAMSYHDAPEPAERGDDVVVVARYARRRDYHRALKRRLVALGRFLVALVPGARWRPAVDSAPVLERELAWRAGLGWIGRNTCLIDRRLGSELDLFSFPEEIGSGLAVFHPKGGVIRREMEASPRSVGISRPCPWSPMVGPAQQVAHAASDQTGLARRQGLRLHCGASQRSHTSCGSIAAEAAAMIKMKAVRE